jgi:hypothetical protein
MKRGGRGGGFLDEFVIRINPVLFQEYESAGGGFQIEYAHPLNISVARSLLYFSLYVNEQARTFLGRGILGGFAFGVVIGFFAQRYITLPCEPFTNRGVGVILSERIEPEKFLAPRWFYGRLLSDFYFAARLAERDKQVGERHTDAEGIIYHLPQFIPAGRRFSAAQIFGAVVAFGQSRFFDNRQPMLNAYHIADAPERDSRMLEILKLFRVVKRDRIEKNMRVGIIGIGVRCDDELMFAPRPPHRQFVTNIQRLPCGHFTRLEALPDLITDDITLTLITSRPLLIHPL